MGLFKTFSNIRRKIWDYFSCDLEYNFVNWQRLSIYLCLVLIISALFLLQYVGWMGERWMFLLPFRIFINVLFTGTFIAFLFRKILLSTALSVSIGLDVYKRQGRLSPFLSMQPGLRVYHRHSAPSFCPRPDRQ